MMKKILSITLGLGGLIALILCGWLLFQSSKASKNIEKNLNQFIAQQLVFLDFTPFVCDGFSEIVCKSETISYNPLYTAMQNTKATPIAKNIQITLSGGIKSAKMGLSAYLENLKIPLSCDIELSGTNKDIYMSSGEDILRNNKGEAKAMRLLHTQLQCKSQNEEFLQKNTLSFDITHQNFANSGLQEIINLLISAQIPLKEIYFRLNHLDIDLHSNNLQTYISNILFDSAQNSDIERTIFALNFIRSALLDKLDMNIQNDIQGKEIAKSIAKTILIFRDILEDKVHNATFSLHSKADTTPFVQIDRYTLPLVIVTNYALNANASEDFTQSLESTLSQSSDNAPTQGK